MSQVRVSENTHEVLRSLSTREGKSMQDIIDKAIEDYRRKAFLEGLSNDYRLLRENPEAWKDHEEETALWDNTLMDGLKNE
ncbi:MAG: toxin-antitoxin system protein [Acidobacteria bacterium]|nr:toxin-antitoxin system protein [Acidobacteriota bacterium]